MQSLLFGDALTDAVQYTIGKAWRKRTASAMKECAVQLDGMRTLLNFVGASGDAFRIGNEVLRCKIAAEILEREGK
jgi:hypothetical protein